MPQYSTCSLVPRLCFSFFFVVVAFVGPGSRNFNGNLNRVELPSFTMTSFQSAHGQVVVELGNRQKNN